MVIVGLATLAIIGCSQKKVPGNETPAADSNASNSGKSLDLVTLPTFTMSDSKGNVISLESLKGRKVFVNLWASWCPPCRREMPSIQRLYKSLDTTKVAFVLLSLDDNFEKSRRFASSAKLTLPLFYPAESLPPLFNVEGIPSTFIFNEEGSLIKQVNGSDDYDTEAYRLLLK